VIDFANAHHNGQFMGVPKKKRQWRAFEGYVSLKGPFFVQLLQRRDFMLFPVHHPHLNQVLFPHHTR
jgi:hypothetical protein